MLRTGAEHLERLRDGRIVYIGGERVEDVTAHPAFAGGARTMAAIYDLKADPANRELMSYEENGERYSTHFLMARDRDDLQRRTRAHKVIGDLTQGMFGRSPDHTASFLTGLAMNTKVFDRVTPGYGENLRRHYEYSRDNDIYAAYAVLPPAGARNPEYSQQHNLPVPTLSVVDERDDGLVINGLKMLATGSVYADELWVGNALPLAPNQVKQSVTCAVPCNAPGLSLWSRKPLARDLRHPADYPLGARLDESDAMVMCENVFVPWEKVCDHDDTELTRDIYTETAAHAYGNHQSNVRFWAKMGLITGVLSKVAQSTGNHQIPSVRDMLGRMAAMEATIGGLVAGQIHDCEDWPAGYVTFNRRTMYAALEWCTQNYSAIIEMLRELTGGSVFQMPADGSVLDNDELAAQFDQYWQTPFIAARERMKLMRLAWDLVGSEFAGRHQQYEKFYAGPYFVVRGHSFREAPWDYFNGIAERIMDAMGDGRST